MFLHRLVRPTSAIKIVAFCVAASLTSPTFANELSLVDAFEKADTPSIESRNKISFKIDDCLFQRILVRLNFCSYAGMGDGDRLITDYVDLREVESIRATELHGKFLIVFSLDFGRPGIVFMLSDRIMNGEEGAFDRFVERSDAAFDAAELNSGRSFSNCDGTPPEIQKQTSISMFLEVEPEGWLRLVDLARECRAPKHLKFSDKLSEPRID